MIHKIREVDISLRGVASERYTLTQREGLKLFQLAVWDESAPPFEEGAPDDQELNWLFESQCVEFWATSEETAYNELCANLTAFHACGLNPVSQTDQPLTSDPVLAWLDHYNVLDLLVIPEGSSKLEQLQIAVDFNDHIVYVLRKMCELVDQFMSMAGADAFYDIVDSEHN